MFLLVKSQSLELDNRCSIPGTVPLGTVDPTNCHVILNTRKRCLYILYRHLLSFVKVKKLESTSCTGMLRLILESHTVYKDPTCDIQALRKEFLGDISLPPQKQSNFPGFEPRTTETWSKHLDTATQWLTHILSSRLTGCTFCKRMEAVVAEECVRRLLPSPIHVMNSSVPIRLQPLISHNMTISDVGSQTGSEAPLL